MSGAAYLTAIRAEERTAHVAARRVVLRNYARKVLTATTIGHPFKRAVALERIASDLICAAWPADLLAKAQELGGACDRARRGELPLAQLADLARAVEAS